MISPVTKVFNSKNQFWNRITIYSPISFCFGHKQVSLIFLLIYISQKSYNDLADKQGSLSCQSCCCFITRREGSQLKLHHLHCVRATANTLMFSTAMPTYDFLFGCLSRFAFPPFKPTLPTHRYYPNMAIFILIRRLQIKIIVWNLLPLSKLIHSDITAWTQYNHRRTLTGKNKSSRMSALGLPNPNRGTKDRSDRNSL